MYSENLILSAENPRPFAFQLPLSSSSTTTSTTLANAKPMSNEIAQKPPPSILVGRFKTLLKQRDDELRATLIGGAGHVPPPSTEEIVQIYEMLLSELTCNLKPIITDLTIIAEQQREHARGIADAICARILEVCLGFRGKVLLFFFFFLEFCKNPILEFGSKILLLLYLGESFSFRNLNDISWVLSLLHFILFCCFCL
ncbi:hypothetical protein PIB30_014178 [Stylosanthes scabra]|uniref:CID domain-containing protein n=1 Tax=Stylosanthes scabra TaxID=79078 RepID=A0ABU6V8Y3_9FABA|nr:hypothetical protein [Stylosanthes scabra]